MKEEQQRLAEELLFGEEKKPSFAKRLYFGAFESSKVFPYPEPTAEEKEEVGRFLSKVLQFAEKEIDADKIDREAKIPRRVIAGLADHGVLGMTVPVEYGGLGMSQWAYCRLTEELGRHCASTTLLVNVHQSIGLKALLLFGTAEQKARWLPDLASGKMLAAFALTEPNAGTDASNVQTSAIYDSEKKIYRVNGEKQWITNGSMAGVLTVMARTEDGKITAFLVNPTMAGFQITSSALEKVGFRGTHTATMSFKEMEVPEENVLGEVGSGLKIALTVLDFGRTTFGALCTGIAKECYSRALAHAETREQFDRPLASFGLVKQKLARMAALVEAMEATTYMTAGLIDAGEEDIMLESTMLKVFASDALWKIIYDTMQIFGGRSFFTDEPFERMMRDARLNMIGEGANEAMRAFIGAVGMRDVGMTLQHWKPMFRHLRGLCGSPKVPVTRGDIQEPASQLGNKVRRFGRSVVKCLARYREGIVEEQLVLDRIATCAMALYTTASVLSKLEAHPEHGSAIGNYYSEYAFKQIQANLSILFDPFDEVTYKLSDQLTGIGNP